MRLKSFEASQVQAATATALTFVRMTSKIEKFRGPKMSTYPFRNTEKTTEELHHVRICQIESTLAGTLSTSNIIR